MVVLIKGLKLFLDLELWWYKKWYKKRYCRELKTDKSFIINN